MLLTDYMSSTFPGLSLVPPLFYKWPIGIRFELGTDQADMGYDEVVLHRACTLYEAALAPGDLCWIVSGTTKFASIRPGGIRITGNRYRTFCPTVFKLRKPAPFRLRGPAGRFRLVTEDNEDTLATTTFRWARIQPRAIDYKSILQAKANDYYHLRRPRTCDRVYFVNRTRNLILHMYDDRGLDIMGARRSDIQLIYDAHRSWILDYDRARIERVFEQAAE